MSITPDEQKQFDSIVSDFKIEDTSGLKEMAKKDRNSEMGFIPLPGGINGIRSFLDKTLFVLTIVLAVGGVFAFFAGSHETLLFLAGLTLLCIAVSFFVAPARSSDPHTN